MTIIQVFWEVPFHRVDQLEGTVNASAAAAAADDDDDDDDDDEYHDYDSTQNFTL